MYVCTFSVVVIGNRRCSVYCRSIDVFDIANIFITVGDQIILYIRGVLETFQQKYRIYIRREGE